LPNRKKLRARRDKSREPSAMLQIHDWTKGNFPYIVDHMINSLSITRHYQTTMISLGELSEKYGTVEETK